MDLESIPVHANASPSAHPSAAQRFLDHPVDRVAQLGREFAETLEDHYPRLNADVTDKVAAIRKNADLTPEARQRQIDELKRLAVAVPKEAARQSLSYLIGRVEVAIENATKEMEGSLGQFHQLNLETEIREYVRALPAEKRMPFVLDAARKGNAEVVSAALDSQRFLSGFDVLDDDAFAAFRREALGLLDPNRAVKVAELEGLRKAVSDALTGLDWESNDPWGSSFA